MAKSVNPPDYRAEICTRILRHVLRGESCTVLGVGSSGKSNVARQLAWAEARAHCLRGQTPDAAGVLGVLVDFLNDTSGDAAGFYRLFLEALMKAATSEDALERIRPLRADLIQLWERSTETTSPDRVRVYLQEAITRCFKGGITHLFFVLDDFDKQLESTAPAILNSLRAIRDDHKGRLAYIAMLRREAAFVLNSAGKDRRVDEDLLDLITKQVFAVGRFEGPDIDIFIKRLLEQGTRGLGAAEVQRLVAWAGGHAGLMKTLYGAVEKGNLDLLAPHALSQAQQRADVRVDCQIIWDSLDKQEHTALLNLAQPSKEPITTATAGVLKRLENKGLVAAGVADYEFASPLFAYFVARRAAPAGNAGSPTLPTTNATHNDNKPVILMDDISHMVRIDGRDVRLDAHEYQVFGALYARRNADVSLSAIFAIVQQYAGALKLGGPPDLRVQRVMADLMGKINTPTRAYIVQLTDSSYRFQE